SPTTPMIIAGLDSRTYGTGLTSTTVWPVTMKLNDTSYNVVDLGVAGQTAFDACLMFDQTFGLQATPNSVPMITMLWGGVNDYSFQNARQIANSLRCMVVKAKAIGSRVVLATEVSATGRDPNKNALNAILRAEAYGWGVDNLAELATDPHIGADNAYQNTGCFPDGLHPGPGCEPYISTIMQNAANDLIGSNETSRHQSAAAAYQEVAGDRFLDLTGTAAQTLSLPSCVGYSLPRQVVNLGAAGATVATVNSETLAGSGALASGAKGVFLPVPNTSGSAGCSWERTQ
ncbi:MAG: SGNH/GDSL hydrolase family protein, partial [Janthinobacterium lividum]